MARAGRPGRARGELGRGQVLDAALARLSRGGPEALSLRALAADLKVTPMAVYNHVDGIEALIAALAERVFGPAAPDGEAPGPDRLRAALVDYCTRVAAHPGLMLRVLSAPRAAEAAFARVNDEIRAGVSAAGAPPLWADILVDHLHGFALSMALGGADAARAYPAHLDALLAAMPRGG